MAVLSQLKLSHSTWAQRPNVQQLLTRFFLDLSPQVTALSCHFI